MSELTGDLFYGITTMLLLWIGFNVASILALLEKSDKPDKSDKESK